MKRARKARGQTLMLWALSLLLLSLMVMITLGLGMRIRQRIETQMAADAAAYSQAVAVARAMNAIALLNRMHVSHMVAMTAVESLISWSGQVKALLDDTLPTLQNLANQVNSAANPPTDPTTGLPAYAATCSSGDVTAVQNAITTFTNNLPPNINDLWKAADVAAGGQALSLQGIAVVKADQQTVLERLVNKILYPQAIPNRIAALASNGELKAGTKVNGWSPYAWLASSPTSGGTSGASGPLKVIIEVDNILGAAYASMGSRGDIFTRLRNNPAQLNYLQGIAPVTVTTTMGVGGAGFGAVDGKETSQQLSGVSGYAAWGEDHASSVTASYSNGTCSQSATTNTGDAWVMSTDRTLDNDQHQYDTNTPSLEFQAPLPKDRHTMGMCVSCPGMWPLFMDYDEKMVTDTSGSLFGQPVLFSVMSRDLTTRMDPWNLKFNLTFDKKAPVLFDNGNPTGTMATQDELRYQVALATAITYYHRPNHFKEPPNLFNPFWRATLISAQTHQPGSSPPYLQQAATQVSNEGFATHAQLLNQFYNVGFRGVQ